MPEQMTRITAPDDPERCEGISTLGQCQLKKVPNSRFCPIHGGTCEIKRTQEESLYRFRNAQYRQRVNDFNKHEKARNINEEIGVIRMLIEERINACDQPADLMLHSQGLSELTMKLNVLVNTAAKLDQQMNNTLTRAQVESFTAQLIQIISKHVPPELLEVISAEMANTLGAV